MRDIVGLDVGQSVDPTAVCVLEVVTRKDELDKMIAGKPSAVDMSWYPKNRDGGIKDPHGIYRVDVRHLERLPLQMPYPEQIEHVKRILGRPPLESPKTDLVLDRTGVGAAVSDLFVREGLDPVMVTITAGDGESRGSTYRDWRVSKLSLVSRLQAMLHGGQLKIAEGLDEAQALVWELQDFRATASDHGNWRFGARSGRHDDLVLALAIGAWWAAHDYGKIRSGWTTFD